MAAYITKMARLGRAGLLKRNLHGGCREALPSPLSTARAKPAARPASTEFLLGAWCVLSVIPLYSDAWLLSKDMHIQVRDCNYGVGLWRHHRRYPISFLSIMAVSDKVREKDLPFWV